MLAKEAARAGEGEAGEAWREGVGSESGAEEGAGGSDGDGFGELQPGVEGWVPRGRQRET